MPIRLVFSRSQICWLLPAWLLAAQLASVLAADPASYRVVRDLTYVSFAGGGQTADVYLPTGAGPHPGVLLVHGGAWAAGNKHHGAWHARRLAQRGFAVLSINYRLAPEHPFPAQLEDCRAALCWMVEQADRFAWDPNRLAGYGYSAGGHLVCLLGMSLTAPPLAIAGTDGERADLATEVQSPAVRLRAIVAGGTPCDFGDEPAKSERLAFWLGGTRAERPDVYRQASPASFVSPQSPPIFLFHGQRDRVVPISDPRSLFQRLRRQGVATELYVVPEAGHLAAYLDQAAFEKSVDFLHRQLGEKVQE